MPSTSRLRLFTLAAGAILIVSCGDGTTSVPNPESTPNPKLVFASGPLDAIAGRTLASIQVRVDDGSGGVMTESSAPITIAIAQGTGPTGVVLAGTLTRNAVAGIATFDGLTITKAGSGYKMTATSSGLASVTSDAFGVAPNVPDRLIVASSLGSPMAGEPFVPVTVRAEDAFGNAVTNAANTVTLSLAGGPSGAQLGGTVTRVLQSGVATFDNVTIDRSGTGFSLTASTPGLASATSSAFSVVVSVKFTGGAAPTGLDGFEASNTVGIEVQDPIGTLLPGVPVTWSVTTGTITPISAVTNSIGRADARWRLGPGTQTLTVKAAGTTQTTVGNGLSRGSCAFNAPAEGVAFAPRDTLRYWPNTRTLRVAALFIDFPDLAATRTIAQMMTDIVNPAVQMLSSTTDGKLKLEVVPTASWIRMPENANALRPTATFSSLAYVGVVLGRHDPTFDFSAIDVVWIFRPSRFDPMTSSGVTNFFQGTNGLPRHDGRELRSFVALGSDVHLINVYNEWPGYGRHVVAHEMGHVYGLPDLYAYQYASPEDGVRFTGGWSFMGWVAPATSWTAAERLYVGALPDTDVLCPPTQPFSANVTLRPIEETSGLRGIGLRSTATRMTFLEIRAALGMDAGFCSTGVLIYDVNGAESFGNGPIRVREIHPSAPGAEQTRCGVKWNAAAQVGDIIQLGDPAVEVRVLSRAADGSVTVLIARQ